MLQTKKKVVGLDYEEHKKKHLTDFYPTYVSMCKEFDLEPKSLERFIVEGIPDPDEKRISFKAYRFEKNINKIFKNNKIH